MKERMREQMTTWRKLLTMEMDFHDETLSDMVGSNNLHLDVKFNAEFDDGKSEGKPFTVWSKERVYFTCEYDGLRWVDSLSRNPCSEDSEHISGSI